MHKLLLLLLALTTAGAAVGGAGPQTTLRSTPHEVVRISASGPLQWRHAFPGFNVISTGHVGPDVIVLADHYGGPDGTPRLEITVLSDVTGQVQWQRIVPGRLAGDGDRATTPEDRGWGVVNGTLWVGVSNSRGTWSSDNLGFRVQDGDPLWALSGTAFPRAVASGEVLFRIPTPTPYDLVNVELVIIKLQTGARRTMNFRIAERAGCGSMDDSIVLENFLEMASARFFDAQRHDRCGYFVTRFDWHGSEQQRPVIRVP